MAEQVATERAIFTKEMKKTHTILCPDMAPIHFRMIKDIFAQEGLRLEVLQNDGPGVVRSGLRYVHNDMCYPALLVIGQMIDAIESGKYDAERVAVMITQTGGGCRASNYIHLLRKALARAGYGQVPVVSINLNGMETNPGFSMNLPLMLKGAAALCYGDTLMMLVNQIRPYERQAGAADALLDRWIERLSAEFARGRGYSYFKMKKRMREMAEDFARIPVTGEEKIKVGIVGEIYVKYAKLGNNNLEEFLQKQGCEYRVPGVLGFIMYAVGNGVEDRRFYGSKWSKYAMVRLAMWYLKKVEKSMIRAVSGAGLTAHSSFEHGKKMLSGVVSPGCKMGEGWLLTAEMMELVKDGFPNVICTQPFGCLPNHINGRGMMNRIKEMMPEANLVAIDYDPGAARVNQENRIKLMLASAARPSQSGRSDSGTQGEPARQKQPGFMPAQ